MNRISFSLAAVLIALTVAAPALAQQGESRRGLSGSSGGLGVTIVGVPEVQKELGATEEQKKQLEPVVTEAREKLRGVFGNFREFREQTAEQRQQRREENRKKIEELTKNTEEKLGKILDSKQMLRLKQLRLQQEGPAALARGEVASQIELNQEQQEKILKIQEEARGEAGGATNFRELSEEKRRELFAKFRERREKARADTLGVLTPEQKQKWTELQGPEFKFPEPRRGGDNQ